MGHRSVMSGVRIRHLLMFAAFSLGWLQSEDGFAQEEGDTAALTAVGASMEQLMVGENDEALEALKTALGECAEAKCETNTRALVLMSIGIVYGSGKKDLARAQQIFEMALREDPSLQIDRQFATPPVQEVFAAAKASVGDGPGTPPGATRIPPTKEQLRVVLRALETLEQGEWSSCLQTLIGEMAQEEHAAGRLALARCQEKGGLMLEAAGDASRAADLALAEGNDQLGAQARDMLEQLKIDTPRVILVIPASIDNPIVKIDTEEVDVEAATTDGIPRNPGKVTILVTGKKGSYPFKFEATERVDRGEQITVDVLQGSEATTPVQQCILAAKTAEDVNLCIETGGRGRGLTFRGALEMSTYNDDDHVDVASPSLALSLENPTSGWSIGGSVLVDVVSAASADIVATASRRFDQTRVASTLGGDYRFGAVKAAVGGALSVESDYVGRSIGGSVSADLADKRITPTLGYTFGFDILGRDGTPFDEFSRDIIKHSIDLSASAVVNPETVALAGLSLQIESGDQSKPYRHIPMFSGPVAAGMPRGATPSLVAAFRLPPAPLEQLPEDRTRFAFLARAAHRLETITLRGDERVYLDNWGMVASTTDLMVLIDLAETTHVGPHVRFHIQGPVDFWQRAYVATPNAIGFELPALRTGDRELGPLVGATLGGRFKHNFNDTLSGSVHLDGVYTQYLDHLYIFDRFGFFTATTLEVKVE